MPITAECSDCGKIYEAHDAWAGRHFRCPNCGATMAVPIPPGYEHLVDPSIPLPPEGYPVREAELSTVRAKLLNDFAERSVSLDEDATRTGVSKWILTGVAILLLAGGGLIVTAVVKYPQLREFALRYTAHDSVLGDVSLVDARRNHVTQLLQSAPSQQAYDAVVPPEATVVEFASDGRQLIAWLAKPAGPGPFPAVLYAHGGFALGESDFADAQPFLQAGYAVLLPAWRGENGNPGSFEMCYGEVTDAAAALDYLSAQSDIDPARLFAAGHSVGGTIVMLLAEISPRLRGAMACGGCPDMQKIVELQQGPVLEVPSFNWHDPVEGDLRSPARHVRDLGCPLSLFYGASGDEFYLSQAQAMQLRAAQLGKTVHVQTVLGADHFGALAPAIQQAIAWFRSLAPKGSGS